MSMTGADAEELLHAARRLDAAADQLDAESASLHGILRAVTWLGSIATRFLALFEGEQQPKMSSTAQFIRDASAALVRQANEQKRASESNGSSFGYRPLPAFREPGGGGGGGGWRSETPEERMKRFTELVHGGATAEGIVDFLRDFKELKQLEGFKSVFTLSDKAPGPLAVFATGWDLADFANEVRSGHVDGSVRRGLDVGFDVAGMAYPPIGVLKLGWDGGYKVGTIAGDQLESHFHTSDVIYDATIARRYHVDEAHLTVAQADEMSRRYSGGGAYGNIASDMAHDAGRKVMSWFR